MRRVWTLSLIVVAAAAAAAPRLAAADDDLKSFDVPAGDASNTLKLAAEQAGLEIMFLADTVRGVETNAVKGQFTIRQALDLMLVNTDLTVVQDEKTGAISVRHKTYAKDGDDPPPPVSGPPSINAAPGVPPPSEQPLKLDPFEVSADPDNSYGALNSNSVTAFNVALDKLPISADIFDQTFMNDVGATSVEALITAYSAGAGFANQDPSTNAVSNQPGDRPGGFFVLRGFNAPQEERDGFISVGSFGSAGSTGTGYTSTFDIERVEVIDGPQALLYGGGGGAGGVVNVVSKQARIGQPAFGSIQFQEDQYGTKTGQLDYGMSADDVAVRVALIDSDQQTHRVNVGGDLRGSYAQVAFKLFGNTVVRLNGEQTTYNRLGPGQISSVTFAPGDPRNNLGLRYMLATDEIGATNPATGAPYPGGAVDNGFVNWGNVDSYQGELSTDGTINTLATLTVESDWSSWLSTQFALGYDNYFDDTENVGFNFYAPGATGNPLPGWTEAATPADTQTTNRTKVMRFSALATNDWFGGRVHSQAIIGADYARSDSSHIAYAYEEADSNFNVIYTPGVTANDGRTVIGKQYWSIDDGPVFYPLFWRQTPDVTVGGVNYVRQLANPINPALISPADPLGTSLTSGNYQVGELINKGIYGISYTQWLNGKLDVLAGFRLGQYYNTQLLQSKPFFYGDSSNAAAYNFGVDYALTSLIHPYVTVSDSYTPPLAGNQFDPFNAPPKTTEGIGEEVGIKIGNPSGTISGSIAAYYANDKNDLYPLSPTISNDINPSGLNGGGGGSFINVNRQSDGVQVTLTSAPSPNWRMRLSAAIANGTIKSTVAYNEVYNDQFYENAAGDVTYADGTVVYVSPTFNSKTPVVTASTPGAVPLTVTLMSTPSSAYYANPNTSGQINATSNAATVLRVIDPVHGPILTGATLLPISNYQLLPALDGVTPPGYVVAAQNGDQTTGYPEFSMNYTTVYTIPAGWLKGFRLGGTVSVAWKMRDYYWYPDGIVYTATAGAPRIPFYLPTIAQFNAILGYSRRFSRVTFSTQLNINNLFNHYNIVILPNEQLGYTSPSSLTASYTAQPRYYLWSNTLSF